MLETSNLIKNICLFTSISIIWCMSINTILSILQINITRIAVCPFASSFRRPLVGLECQADNKYQLQRRLDHWTFFVFFEQIRIVIFWLIETLLQYCYQNQKYYCTANFNDVYQNLTTYYRNPTSI